MINEDYINRVKNIIIDFDDYLKALERNYTKAIRINKADVNEFLLKCNMDLAKIEYSKNSFYLNNMEKLGGNPFHHAGIIYSQEPSAMIPVNAYDIKDDMMVLDLCASPGGKSGQIAEVLTKGLLISNEIDKKRSKILYSNIERLGFDNVIITNNNSYELSKTFNGFFDLILVDAPCSGEGMMRKEEQAMSEWNLDNVLLCANRDKEILDNADKMLKKDGILIYSTCTFEIEENEDIVNYLINKGYELIDTNESIKKYTVSGINMEKARRFYPHKGIGEGQFVAVLKKLHDEDYKPIKSYKINKNKIVEEFIKKYTNMKYENIVILNDKAYYLKHNYDLSKLNLVSNGVYLGEIIKNRFEPSHYFFKAFGNYFKNKVDLDINDPRLNKYLRGEEIIEGNINGYGVITLLNVSVGGFKGVNGILKNYYPKGLRNF